jgi:acyl CoA:acetate/3-ketoacid CoA transferase
MCIRDSYNTDHLFIAKPAPDAEKIRVTAKDRWGNIYSEEMILG